jgi:hypothetical protein
MERMTGEAWFVQREQSRGWRIRSCMKTALAVAAMMVLALTCFAEDIDQFTPAVSLEDALVLVKGYVQETNVDTSEHYLKSIELKFENNGKSHYWDAQWMGKSRGSKGDWFIIRVDMKRTCSLLQGM